ncbi:MAG: flavodoxin domain-containing protein [Lachnospiraceae bacterium]|nr:flavodoxin domain-containing protein [Lachnospiraceae bacterium]
MKTLILYATKNGAAREIAERIAKITGGIIHDLSNENTPDLSHFDCIILGSSIYVGMVRKELKTFLEKNADNIRDKKLGLFVSGLDESSEKEYFKNNFSAEIINAAKAMSFLGGIFDPKKAGFFGRLVMKAAAKKSEYTNTISDEKIKQFAEVMKI